MATPRQDTSETSRHYIGTPRAGSILSAFLDFDDTEVDTVGPPLDFDQAMAEFEANAAAGQKLPGFDGSCGAMAPADECDDSSGSTMYNVSDAERSPGAADASDSELDSEDGEDDVEEREESYESDFETDTESEEEEEEAAGAKTPSVAGDVPPCATRRRTASRGAVGSRAGSRTRGAAARSGSRSKGTREPSAAGRRSRADSRGAVQRLRSLDRVLTLLSSP